MVPWRAPQSRQNSIRVNDRNMNMNSPPKSYATETSTKGGPQFSSQQGGDLRIRVRHREYVCDVEGTTDLNVASLPINPGLVTLFPWLSQIAGNFESYEFRGLVFEWRTQCSTDDTGKAILSVDFDAEDAPPTSKTEALQQRAKADGPVWQNFKLVCSPQDLKKFGPQKYVRTGSETGDIKTYDVGNLNILTANCSNQGANGELYVEYDVELMTPSFSNWISQYSCKLAGGTVSLANGLLGTTPICSGNPVTSLDSSVPNLSATSGNTITFAQVGQYLLDVVLAGTGLTDLTAAGATPGGSIAIPLVSALASAINSTATAFLGGWLVDVSEPGQQLTFTPSATTLSASSVRVAAYEYELD